MKVLCVCTGNTCRSPMLAALLARRLGDRAVIESAATLREASGRPATDYTLAVTGAHGYDLSTHRSRWIGDLDLVQFDRIYCMEQEQVRALRSHGVPPEKIVLVNEAEGGVPNPYGEDFTAYEECFDLLERAADHIARTQ